MPNVKYFTSERGLMIEDWKEIYDFFGPHPHPIPCDVSVVLNGKFVNPLPLYGKKILLYKIADWQPVKWKAMYQPVIEEYYDTLIDITNRNLEEVRAEIEKVY